MGDLRFIESALSVLDKKDYQQKAGIQGNVFRRILNYLDIDEDEYVSYEEVRNGKAVDCLISYGSVNLPINFVSYSKDKRNDVNALNESIKNSSSLLKQFMIANNLPLGIVTNGYTLVFFELNNDGELDRIRNIWLSNLIKDEDNDITNGISSDREFLSQYDSEHIKDTFEKYLDLEGLKKFVKDNIVNTNAKLVDWVYEISGVKYPLDVLQEMIKQVYYDDILLERKEKVYSNRQVVNMSEEDTKLRAPKEIVNLNIDSFQKLKLIEENPVIVEIANDKLIEFTNWRDLSEIILNYIISKDINAYNEFVDKYGRRKKFLIIRQNDSTYNIYLNDSNYRKLENGDLLYSSIDRVGLCKYAIDGLKAINYLKFVKPCLIFMYQDDSELVLSLDNKVSSVEDDSDLDIPEEIKIYNSSKIKGKSYKIYGKYFEFKGFRQIVEDILNTMIEMDKKGYEKVKELEIGIYFFIINDKRLKNIREYHKVKTLKNGDTFVLHGAGDDCLRIADLLLSYSTIQNNGIEFLD